MIEYNLINNKAIDSFEYEQQVLRSLSAEDIAELPAGAHGSDLTKAKTKLGTHGNSYRTSCRAQMSVNEATTQSGKPFTGCVSLQKNICFGDMIYDNKKNLENRSTKYELCLLANSHHNFKNHAERKSGYKPEMDKTKALIIDPLRTSAMIIFENMEDKQHNEACKLEQAKTLFIAGQNLGTDMQVLPYELTYPSGSKYEWIELKNAQLAPKLI